MTSNLLECTLHKYPQIYCTDPRLPTFPVHNNLQKSGCSIPADCKDIFIEHVPHPALHLEEVLEDHPHRGHEQQNDADGVANATGLAERLTEASGVLDVLGQQETADAQGDDVTEDGTPHIHNMAWGGDDEKNEGSGQLKITCQEHGTAL